jgi:hypothetical protein
MPHLTQIWGTGDLEHEIAAQKRTQHHDQRRQTANDAGTSEEADGDQRDEGDRGVAEGIGLVDVVMAEYCIEGEEHHAHAESEIAAIGIDDEFEKEGQPDPAPAVEIVLLLEPALDRGSEGKSHGREGEQPRDR